MEEKDFNKKYWFGNLKMVTVINPRKDDYVFGAVIDGEVDMETGKLRQQQRTYRVKAGAEERLPGPIANMYLDQMSKLLAQDEANFHNMIDFALKAQYYDSLIIDVEDLVQTYQPLPQYLNTTPKEDQAEEVAFAGKDEKDEQPTAAPTGAEQAPKAASRRPEKVA